MKEEEEEEHEEEQQTAEQIPDIDEQSQQEQTLNVPDDSYE